MEDDILTPKEQDQLDHLLIYNCTNPECRWTGTHPDIDGERECDCGACNGLEAEEWCPLCGAVAEPLSGCWAHVKVLRTIISNLVNRANWWKAKYLLLEQEK